MSAGLNRLNSIAPSLHAEGFDCLNVQNGKEKITKLLLYAELLFRRANLLHDLVSVMAYATLHVQHL
jgi:hypothetical protein